MSKFGGNQNSEFCFVNKYSVWELCLFLSYCYVPCPKHLAVYNGNIFHFLAVKIKNVLFTTLTSGGKYDRPQEGVFFSNILGISTGIWKSCLF